MEQEQGQVVYSKKTAAIITRTDWEENPQPAVQSVIRNSIRFSELHFIDDVWSLETIDYPGWNQDYRMLKQNNVKVIVHSKLDANKIQASLVVELSPYCQLMPGGLNTLMNQVQESVVENPSLTDFAIETGICIPTKITEWKKKPLMVPDAFTSYGFIIAMMVFDTIRRYWINFGNFFYRRWGAKYALTTDVRAKLIYKTYGKHYIPSEQIWWTLINPNHHPIEAGGRGALNVPDSTNQGWRFVLWYFRHHRFLRFGLWIMPFVIYYWIFAYPWWNTLIVGTETRFIQLLMRPNQWQIVLVWWLVNTVYAISVSNRYLDVPFQNLLCFLQPIFVAFLPLVILYSKFHRSRSGWHISELAPLNEKLN